MIFYLTKARCSVEFQCACKQGIVDQLEIPLHRLAERPCPGRELIGRKDALRDDPGLFRRKRVRHFGDRDGFIRRFVRLYAAGKRVRIESMPHINQIPHLYKNFAVRAVREKAEFVAIPHALCKERVVCYDQKITRIFHGNSPWFLHPARFPCTKKQGQAIGQQKEPHA